MRTRGLKLEFTDDGVITYPKYSDHSEYEKVKIRKVYGTKIKEALLKSFFELKPDLESDGSKATGLNPDFVRKLVHLDDDQVKGYVRNISDKICDSCYDEYSGNLRTLKRKIFEICSNIKRESNSELREKILLRRMSILELVRADTLELAPEDVREQRKKEIEHHYIRNVILKTNVGNDEDEQPPKAEEASTSYKPPTDESTKNQNTIDSLRKFFTTAGPASSSTATSVTTTGGSDTVRKIKRLKTNRTADTPDDTTDNSDNDADKTNISNIFGTTDITSTVGGNIFTSTTPRDSSSGSSGSSSSFRASSSSDNKSIIGSSIRKTKVLNDSEDVKGSERSAINLPTPPYCKHYKFEAVSSRILKRIQSLPAYMVKPFMDPYTAGSKRVQMLLQRSSILLRSLSSH